MPSIYDFKPRFQALLRPLIQGMARQGMTANMVTIGALGGSVGVGWLFWYWRAAPPWLLLPLWLFVRMALNAIDGMMARELNMKSHLGAVLNEMGDVLSDAALYLPLATVLPAAAGPVVLFVLAAMSTEFCGVLGQALGGQRRYDGPMGKSDRAFVVGAAALLACLWPASLGAWRWIFVTLAGLAALTCSNRIAATLKELEA